jgi:hypothetical protein
VREIAAALLLSAVSAFGQSTTCAKPFEAPLSAGRQLSIDTRSGDIEIVGTPKASLRVVCSIRDVGSADDIKVSLAAGRLRVHGGPNRDVKIRIEVPDRTNILVRATAGDLTISGITGDKDVELRAGDLIIYVGKPDLYRVAEASLMAGDLNASPFGVVKDGLFRSFRKENSAGQYRLRAKLMAGDLTLK